MASTFLKLNPHLIESMSIRMVTANAVSQSPYTLQQQVQSFGGMRWEVDVSLKPLDNSTALEVQAFFVNRKGRKNSFLLPMIGSGNSYHSYEVTTCTVNGSNQAIGSETLNITNTSSISLGRMFGLNDRLHLASAPAYQTGNRTIGVQPPLREVPLDNAVLDFTNPCGTFRMASDDVSWGISNSLNYGFSFTCIEAIDG
jgi:hypothetical protein